MKDDPKQLGTVTSYAVPAQSGWYVIEPITEDDDTVRGFVKTPVTAWFVQVKLDKASDVWWTSSRPITLDHNIEEDVGYILLAPDGVFIAPHDRTIGKEETDVIGLLNERKEYEIKRRQRLKEKKANPAG